MKIKAIHIAFFVCLCMTGLRMRAQCSELISDTLAQEGFESGLPAGWKAATGSDGADWKTDAGSLGHYPNPGAGAWTYIRDDEANTAGTAILETASFDLSEYNGMLRVEFDLNFQSYSDTGAMYVDVWDGGKWLRVFEESEDFAGHLSMDMSEFTFSDFRLRFVYDDEGGWGWGMGVDNFRLLGRKGECGDGKCEAGELAGGCDTDCRAAAPSPFWIPPGTNLEGASVAWRSFKGNTPCDDCSEEIALGFDFTFYGQTYKKAFLNSNGNLTFLADFIEYTPAPFCIESPGMIAPFFADADLQRGGKIEWYADPQHHYFIATWTAVGYFGCQGACALRNTFQVILTDGSIRNINGEIVPQGATILFVYGDMQWTAGSSSGGSAGLGGAPATVGVNLGDGALCMDHGAFDREGYIYYGNSQDEGCEPNAVSHLDHRCLFFNGETGQSIVPGTAVHVQLLNQPGGHQIIWQTERPDLVSTFRIERSQDSLAFLTLLEAPPGDLAQNPPGVFTHTDTRFPGGKVYYRILSQLKDGTLIYSETAEIESAIRPDDAYPSDTALNLKVGPNPFSEYIDVSFSLEKPASVRYLLTDMSGRAFASGDIDAVTGSNSFRIQTGSLPAAMFVITLFEGSRKAHRNLVRQ